MFLKSDLFLIRIVLIHFEFCLSSETSKVIPKVTAYFFLAQRLSSRLHIFMQQLYITLEKLDQGVGIGPGFNDAEPTSWELS